MLHTERGDWSFHVLFSNTGLAHRLGRTRDWVVIFFERDGDEDQVTVVTETRGELAGKRVVRGRELECHAWYRSRTRPPAALSHTRAPKGNRHVDRQGHRSHRRVGQELG